MDRNSNKKEAAENPNRARTFYYVNIILLCALTLISLFFALVVFFRLRTRGTDGVRKMYTEKQIRNIREAAAEKEKKDLLLRIQTSLESGQSTTRMLREIFDDSIVVVEDGRYYFYPMVDGVKKNPLAAASLVRDGDMIRYEGKTPAVEIRRGVLLTDENGKVDWDRLAGSGITEVTIRAGTVTEAGFLPDSQFTRNCSSAAERELRFRMSIDLQEPAGADVLEDAADAVREMIERYGGSADAINEESGAPEESAGTTDPSVILRILPAERLSEEMAPGAAGNGPEKSEGRESLTDTGAGDGSRSEKKWTASLKSLCGRIEDAGGAPVIGAGLYTFAARIDLESLTRYDRWLTDHEEAASFPYRFSFWEYSAEGNAEGVPASSILYVYLHIPDPEVLEK